MQEQKITLDHPSFAVVGHVVPANEIHAHANTRSPRRPLPARHTIPRRSTSHICTQNNGKGFHIPSRLAVLSPDPAIRGRKRRRAVDASWGETHLTDIAPENCPKQRNNSFTYLQMDVPTSHGGFLLRFKGIRLRFRETPSIPLQLPMFLPRICKVI